eukprot:gnl/Hemi2/5047_TR1753_c0_g3_i1.p1 gnl/Hemi2/5047_TR1753_c0_g3~~gnl/Hemi2/5047_TR1753_c0_g3_i1.p1  ORF type:complete len:224 (-),score=3.61 gnl/Hemi2/5047_TR1753_c0_g3_i1:84-755(-)
MGSFGCCAGEETGHSDIIEAANRFAERFLRAGGSLEKAPFCSWHAKGQAGSTAFCKFNASRCQLTDKDAILLAKGLKGDKAVIKLDLSNNLITNEGAFALAKLLESSESIKELNLRSNRISAPGGYALCAAVRTASCLIDSIDLSETDVSPMVLQQLRLSIDAQLRRTPSPGRGSGYASINAIKQLYMSKQRSIKDGDKNKAATTDNLGPLAPPDSGISAERL